MRYQHVMAIRTRLQERGYAPASINATLHALRGVARAAFNLEMLSADDLQRIRDVRPVRGERLPAGRALTPGELAALMDACGRDETAAGVRDGAILALLYAGGLRRAEASSLDRKDYSPETGELRVLGKGGKERLLYVDNGAADALADWLEVRGGAEGPLFLAINKGGRVLDHGIGDQSIYSLLRKRARQAGVRDCSCHDLRRSFISDLLDAGADISTVAKLAGHSQVQTSARYDRRGEDSKRKAIALLHVPYRRRNRGREGQAPEGDSHPDSPRDLLENHLRTGEPLSEDEVERIVDEGLGRWEDWSQRGGGLFWLAEAFPDPDGGKEGAEGE
jgi:site-specific recombinase XerD